MHRLAHDVGVHVEELESCRRGDARLPLDLQMRLAAVALLHAPALGRQARALYAQAQAALRVEAGEVGRHRTYPQGPFEALPHGHQRGATDDVAASVAHLRPQSAVADLDGSDDGSSGGERIAAAARALADQNAPRAEAEARLREAVAHEALALRASGEAPERALILVKSAVDGELAGPAAMRREVMESVVRWFVDAYYGA